MKAELRKIPQSDAVSFDLEIIRSADPNCNWHFHPEYQIGLVLCDNGYRIIGDNLRRLEYGEVVMLGPNLPHVWHLEEDPDCAEDIRGIVVHIRKDFLGTEFFDRPELGSVKALLKNSLRGFRATGMTRDRVADTLQTLPDLQGMESILALLQVLHVLSVSKELEPICSPAYMPETFSSDCGRIDRVCEFLNANFSEIIRREDVASMAHLSPAAFSRFFKARTGKTFQDFVTELRVGHACRLLGQSELNISQVAQKCGFSHISSFDRSFRKVKGVSPRDFRQNYLKFSR